MADLLEQIGVSAFLLVGIWLGWRRWGRPYRDSLDAQGRGELILAVAAVAGGLIGSPFWWMDFPGSFSWTLPPLAARLLAAAAIAFAVTGCYALERRQERLVRSYIVMIAVYLGPLVAAILLLHLDRFDWSAPITYGFFTIAGGMAIAAIWHLVHGTSLGKDYQDEMPSPVTTRVKAWLWLVVTVAGLWGLALFLYPQGSVPDIWVWPQDALTSRLIASMLLTLSAGALLGLRSAAQAAMALWMFVVYGAGAAAACLWTIASGKPVAMSYAAAFPTLAAVSLALLIFDFRSRTATAIR